MLRYIVVLMLVVSLSFGFIGPLFSFLMRSAIPVGRVLVTKVLKTIKSKPILYITKYGDKLYNQPGVKSLIKTLEVVGIYHGMQEILQPSLKADEIKLSTQNQKIEDQKKKIEILHKKIKNETNDKSLILLLEKQNFVLKDLQKSKEQIIKRIDNIKLKLTKIDLSISKNKEKINAISQEQYILGQNIKQMEYSISTMRTDMSTVKSSVSNLQTAVSKLQTDLSSVIKLAQKNKEEIKNIKDNFFISGLEALNNFYSTHNHSDLQSAMTSLLQYKNIANPEIKTLAKFFYLLSIVEDYKYQKNTAGFSTKKDIKKIENYAQSLLSTLEIRAEYSSLLTTTYSILDDIVDKSFSNDYKKGIYSYNKKLIDKLINTYKFDTAVKVASEYKLFSNNNELLKDVLLKRDANYEKYKNKLTISNIDNLLLKYQNTKLREEAVKVLLRYGNKKKALYILDNNVIEDNNFRLKAHIKINYELGNDEKFHEIKKLILDNMSYPDILKQYVKGLK